MTLFFRELKELRGTAIAVMCGITLIMSILHLLIPGPLEKIDWLRGLPFYVIILALAAYIGANVIGGDRERGVARFIDALPISQGQIWLEKTGSALLICLIIMLTYTLFSPGPAALWILLLLSFALGNLFAQIFQRVINAALLSYGFSLIGVVFMDDLYKLLGENMIISSIIYLTLSISALYCSYFISVRRVPFSSWDEGN